MSDLTLDVGQANELKLAFRKNGYNARDVKRLTEGRLLASVLEVLKGYEEIKPVRGPTINCDVEPRIPEHMVAIEEHRKGGQLVWEPSRFRLFYPRPESDRDLSGNTIRKLLRGELVLNACVMDFLLANPNLIPHEWMHERNEYGHQWPTWIHFWGTIFRAHDGSLWVSGLIERDGIVTSYLSPTSDFFPRSFSRAVVEPRVHG